MKRHNLFIAVMALSFSLAGFVQAQGYTVNRNWLNGNGNQVNNVNQSAAKHNLHIYNQPKGQPTVVNQTTIHGHNNTVVNHNQNPNVVHHGPTFGQPPVPGKKLVNLKAMQYQNPQPFIGPNFHPGGIHNHNHVVGNHNTINNVLLQNALTNGLGGIGNAPVVNVNITINTIIGNNNKIVNLLQR